MSNNRQNTNQAILQGMNCEKRLKREIQDENSLYPPTNGGINLQGDSNIEEEDDGEDSNDCSRGDNTGNKGEKKTRHDNSLSVLTKRFIKLI